MKFMKYCIIVLIFIAILATVLILPNFEVEYSITVVTRVHELPQQLLVAWRRALLSSLIWVVMVVLYGIVQKSEIEVLLVLTSILTAVTHYMYLQVLASLGIHIVVLPLVYNVKKVWKIDLGQIALIVGLSLLAKVIWKVTRRRVTLGTSPQTP